MQIDNALHPLFIKRSTFGPSLKDHKSHSQAIMVLWNNLFLSKDKLPCAKLISFENALKTATKILERPGRVKNTLTLKKLVSCSGHSPKWRRSYGREKCICINIISPSLGMSNRHRHRSYARHILSPQLHKTLLAGFIATGLPFHLQIHGAASTLALLASPASGTS